MIEDKIKIEKPKPGDTETTATHEDKKLEEVNRLIEKIKEVKDTNLGLNEEIINKTLQTLYEYRKKLEQKL